jgi:phage N-6-adenine-methyltransferase
MIGSALLSSRSSEWTTPQNLYDYLDQSFQFTLDPCATKTNAKCKRFFTKQTDGLSKKWRGRVFVNPPYGRTIGKWIEKAYREARDHAELVVCLLPARTDTLWWHTWCVRGNIYFLRGRLHFSESRLASPFPSAIVVFTFNNQTAQQRLKQFSCGTTALRAYSIMAIGQAQLTKRKAK